MPTWVAPRTWSDIVSSASHFNVDIRDNQLALKAPPSDNYELDQGSDYIKLSGDYENIDGTNLSHTIVTNGGDVFIYFAGVLQVDVVVDDGGMVDVAVDGTRIASPSDQNGSLMFFSGNGQKRYCSLLYRKTGLSAGSHTFTLMWRALDGSSNITLYAGAGTANYNIHPQFWVREVS